MAANLTTAAANRNGITLVSTVSGLGWFVVVLVAKRLMGAAYLCQQGVAIFDRKEHDKRIEIKGVSNHCKQPRKSVVGFGIQ